MQTITENDQDFKSLERKLFEVMCKIACELMRQFLAWRDMTIMGTRDKARYRMIDKNRETTVKTVFGEVSYTRRYYYDTEAGRYVFLLDEAMGIFCGFGLVSENLAGQIVNECADKSFRKAAGSIGELTGQGISAMGAWNVVQQYGEALGEQEDRLVDLSESGSVGHLGGIQCDAIFDEYDDVWLSRQREHRRKPGTAAKGARKIGRKISMQPMHIGIAYSGWKSFQGGKYRTVNKVAYASFGKITTFKIKFGALLSQRFDMDGVEQRFTNGDGEPWIRTAAEENDSVLQLDTYHRNEAITRAVADSGDRKYIFDAIGEKDVGRVLSAICEMAMDAPDEASQNRLAKLYGYLYSNRDSLLSWQERGIEDLPDPPEGMVYRGMGVQESSNCIITQRMKNRRASWSESGANNMARVLCYRDTIGLDAIMGDFPDPEPIEAFADPLSAAQAPQHDGKGYGADWLYAPMPFEGAFRTHGREVIKGMLRMKPPSQMSFI